ncbi:BACD3 protein, partial [Passerina amoena]|nr:BACD3 protein [Passerina amoena]
QEEMSGESVVSSAVPAAATRTTSFKGSSPSSKYVKLNVGGALYYTTMQTLTKQDTMLKAMFSGRMEVLTDSEGKDWDVPGALHALPGPGKPQGSRECQRNFLEVPLSMSQGGTGWALRSLQPNPSWHSVTQGSGISEPSVLTAPTLSTCSVNSCCCLRSHSNSDDNMLKNIELFDKLSLRFNGRVLFIKDVIGDEICCWSFYGQGRKIAEVCCTSIVYATEKKQTKVEFPEARIYEETLNILLYESQDGRGPDNALLEATGGAAGRSHHLEEDEERERIERVRRIHIKRPDDRAHLHQ